MARGQGIYTGLMRSEGKKRSSIANLADIIEQEQKEEGEYQAMMGPASFLLDMAGKGIGKAIPIPGLGDLVGTTLSTTAKTGLEKFARGQGAGADIGDIKGDFYTGAAAERYKKGFKDIRKQTKPSYGADMLSSVLGSFTPAEGEDPMSLMDYLGLDFSGQSGSSPSLPPSYVDMGNITNKVTGELLDPEGWSLDFSGGGQVPNKAPTIVEYFGMKGKTLGGSNSKSVAQMLGMRT